MIVTKITQVRVVFVVFFVEILILIKFSDDLMGEAVLPVSDLCSNLASKRIIQLHKYGTTKTGSLTAEVGFSC